MKHSSYALLKKSIIQTCLLTLALGVLSGPAKTYALWLPWAKEEDKVRKVVEDVWKALLWNDKRSLKEIIAGPAAQTFVDQQIAAIRKNNVKKYECRFKSIKVDRVQGKIAFAEYSRDATLNDGRVITENLVSVVEKIGGQWRLLPSHKNKKKEPDKKNGDTSDPAPEQRKSSATPLRSDMVPTQIE